MAGQTRSHCNHTAQWARIDAWQLFVASLWRYQANQVLSQNGQQQNTSTGAEPHLGFCWLLLGLNMHCRLLGWPEVTLQHSGQQFTVWVLLIVNLLDLSSSFKHTELPLVSFRAMMMIMHPWFHPDRNSVCETGTRQATNAAMQ